MDIAEPYCRAMNSCRRSALSRRSSPVCSRLLCGSPRQSLLLLPIFFLSTCRISSQCSGQCSRLARLGRYVSKFQSCTMSLCPRLDFVTFRAKELDNTRGSYQENNVFQTIIWIWLNISIRYSCRRDRIYCGFRLLCAHDEQGAPHA